MSWRCVGAILTVVALYGQVSSVYGNLRVSVSDPAGASVPNVVVEVHLLDRNWGRTLHTDSSGTAQFAALLPGEYSVTTRAPGFASRECVVRVRLGHEAVLGVALELEADKQQVTVTADAGGVDTYTIPVHTYVNATEVHGLPVNQRDFTDFVLLDAGLQRDALRVHVVASTSGFNVMGQRPRSNSLQLDGADLNDETTGGVRGSIPMEAVQEFQVLTSGYQAEYGRAAGGVVNIISKSGSNQTHGSGFGFLRHRSLDATNAFSALRNPPYTRAQYGFSFAGPLRKDVSFFFLSAEQLRRQETGFSTIGADPSVFTLTADQQQLKSRDPLHPAIAAAERGLAIAAFGHDPSLQSNPAYRITRWRAKAECTRYGNAQAPIP